MRHSQSRPSLLPKADGKVDALLFGVGERVPPFAEFIGELDLPFHASLCHRRHYVVNSITWTCHLAASAGPAGAELKGGAVLVMGDRSFDEPFDRTGRSGAWSFYICGAGPWPAAASQAAPKPRRIAECRSHYPNVNLRRRRLPHLDVVGQPLFVTFRLDDSLPAQRPFPASNPTSGEAFVTMDRWLDHAR